MLTGVQRHNFAHVRAAALIHAQVWVSESDGRRCQILGARAVAAGHVIE